MMEGEHAVAPITVSAAEKPAHGGDAKLRVFVSYSRKDDAFAQELVTGLEFGGFQPYLDKHDIAAGEEWETRLGRLIEAADTVVFVISPDAVASECCAWEVKRTTELKKRLLPIVWRAVPEAEVPPRLKQLNYIFFDKPHSFAPSLAALAAALRTDLDWIREHTRLGEAALLCEWDEQLCKQVVAPDLPQVVFGTTVPSNSVRPMRHAAFRKSQPHRPSEARSRR
jgi:hypothetical protein